MPITSPFSQDKSPRVKKADRDFAPDGIDIRPGTFGIDRKLYQYVKDAREERPQQRVYASGLKSCARQQAMSIMGFSKVDSEMQDANPQWSVVAEFGTAIHELIEKWLKATGISVQSEFRVTSEDEAVSGRVDHRVRIQQVVDLDLDTVEVDLEEGNGTSYRASVLYEAREAILDVKTVNEKTFKEGAWGDKFPGYIAQISIYCYLLDIPTGIILLVNRNTAEMVEYEFTMDPHFARQQLKRATKIVAAAKALRLPPPEEWTGQDGSFYCKSFCPFYRQCAVQQATVTEDGVGLIQRMLNNGVEPQKI